MSSTYIRNVDSRGFSIDDMIEGPLSGGIVLVFDSGTERDGRIDVLSDTDGVSGTQLQVRCL